MSDTKRPRGRQQNVTGTGSVNKKGSGLGLGKPLGNSGGLSGRPGASGGTFGSGGGSIGGSGSGGSGPVRRRGGGFGCGPVAIIAIMIAFFLLRSCMGALTGSITGGEALPVQTPASSGGGSGSGSGQAGSSQTGDGSLFGFNGFEDYYSNAGSGSSGAGGMDLESMFSSLYGGAGAAGAVSADSDSIDDSYTHSSAYSEVFNNNQTIANGSTSNNNGAINQSVDGTAREKFTRLKGNGKDTVTLMVYMCGTDLESKYGMGTSDIKEMASAALSDKVRVLVYTGGCRRWQNNFASNSYNQIYEVKSGGLNRLEDNFGQKPMTDPATLTEFIKYGVQKYPADRYQLIFWDHGSGTTGGYGYDEKYSSAGSMSLAGIDKAITDAGVKFDFIGFDACLMATLENGLMLSDDADYMIASEETEPGTGWYYKNWLTAISKNTSIPTVELGRMIADDFLAASQQVRQGDQVTLSVTDLSELGATVPKALNAFASSASQQIANKSYKQISDARRNAKEFAPSNRIDQIDVVGFALGVGSEEGKALAQAVKGAVKYNRTSRSYGDAHGLSIYFPYKRVSYIDRVVKTYKTIGMDQEYTKCITAFANVAAGGQAAGGGYSSPFSSLYGGSSTSEYADLFGDFFGSSGSGSSGYSNLFGSGSGSSGYGSSGYGSSGSAQEQLVEALIGSLLSGGSYGGISGLDRSNTEFLDEGAIRSAAEYVFENHINTDDLFWTSNSRGETILNLSQKDWDLIQDAELSVLYDDGEGFIDLGLDSILNYDKDGNLLGEYNNAWMALDGHVVAYYHLDTVDNGDEYAIHGYVPALVNGDLSDILVTFDTEHPNGYVTGFRFHYDAETTDTAPKEVLLKDGDEIIFLCDYYSYEGELIDNYELDRMTVNGEIKITDLVIGNQANAAYRLTDIYGQHYWTPLIPRK